MLEDKTGQGPKPNKARIIFFQSVTKCYLFSTSIPGAPWKDRITGEVKGELYFYLKACLDPLGTNDTPSSILKAFEKTIGALPDFKHRCNL